MTTVVFAAAMHTPLPRWVINRRAGHSTARQLNLQHRTGRRTVGAAVQGHFLPHALAAKAASHFASDRGAGHRPAVAGVILSYDCARRWG
jgi:hypothetical protein